MQKTSIIALVLSGFTCGLAVSQETEPAPRRFSVWATSCAHLSTDLRFRRDSLGTAIRHSEGQVDGVPGFDWDIMLNAGDLCGTNTIPSKKDGFEYLRQTQALTAHMREQIYSVAGNHDAGYCDEDADNWFTEWIDPLGDNTKVSKIRNYRRPFKVTGTWARYRFVAGNILFLMLSDRNDAPQPIGRGARADKGYGGYPAGAITRETFEWWKQQVLENQDKVIVTVHHHVLRDTTTASGEGEGKRYHHSKRDREHASYLHFVFEEDGSELEVSSATEAFHSFFREFEAEHGKPAIDLWIGGHTHVAGPEDRTGGKSITETRFGVTFLQVAALTQFHGGSTPLSRVLEFEDGRDSVTAKVFLHQPYRVSKRGFFEPGERTISLRHPVVAPEPYVAKGSFPAAEKKLNPRFLQDRPMQGPSDLHDAEPSFECLGASWTPEDGGSLGVVAALAAATERDPRWPSLETDDAGRRFMRFTGSERVRVGPIDWSHWQRGASIAAWVRLEKSHYLYPRRVFSLQRKQERNGFKMIADNESRKFRLAVWNESKRSWSSLECDYDQRKFFGWQLLVVVMDPVAGEVRLFVNGKQADTAGWNGGELRDRSNTTFVIGADSGEWQFSQAWLGGIGEVSAFPRPLDADEIKRMWRLGR